MNILEEIASYAMQRVAEAKKQISLDEMAQKALSMAKGDLAFEKVLSKPGLDYILEDVRTKVESVEGIKGANVNLVFEPAWDQSMMSEEARVELGFD